MKSKDLISALHQFTGTQSYYRLHPKVLLTDGAKFLADEAGAYWLMDAIGSYLASFKANEYFICATLRTKESGARLVLDNGSDVVLAVQTIPYTDFPLLEIKLYCVWDGQYWVILLPGEY
jgi:hypothetical protein